MSAIVVQKNGLPSFSKEALINQLKGLQSSELDAFIQKNIFKLSQINDCAKKALESLSNGSTNYTSDGLFTNIHDQIESEQQRTAVQSELEKCIREEDSRLKERYGLIFGSIASIFSRLFGTIGETHKIIASIAIMPTFVSSTSGLDGLEGLTPATLEFEPSVNEQTLEYKDL